MPLITLTTDWHTNSFYVGALKGRLLSKCPGATIVDISHEVHSFNVAHAAFIVRNSYHNFPDGTIHLIGVNIESTERYPYIVLKAENQYFISQDNGIPGLIFENGQIQTVRSFEFDEISDKPTFSELDGFVSVISLLIETSDITQIGGETKAYRRQIPYQPSIDNSVIIGRIIFIDAFQNAITNVTRELFNQVGQNRRFSIFVQSNKNIIEKISQYYNDVEDEGELLAIFNSIGLLEIAMFKGRVAELIGLNTDSTIRINFYDSKK